MKMKPRRFFMARMCNCAVRLLVASVWGESHGWRENHAFGNDKTTGAMLKRHAVSSLFSDEGYVARLRASPLSIRSALFVAHNATAQKGVPVAALLASAHAGCILEPPILVPISFRSDVLAMEEDVQGFAVGQRSSRIGSVLGDETPTAVEHLQRADSPTFG